MAIGATTGVVEFTANDIRVNFNEVPVAQKGSRCSVAIKPDAILKADGTPVEETVTFERLHRGDKIFIWENI